MLEQNIYCHKVLLVIEIDGSQHYTDDGLEKDIISDEHMKSLGLRVLRFSNIDILKNIEGVKKSIQSFLS